MKEGEGGRRDREEEREANETGRGKERQTRQGEGGIQDREE